MLMIQAHVVQGTVPSDIMAHAALSDIANKVYIVYIITFYVYIESRGRRFTLLKYLAVLLQYHVNSYNLQFP